MARLSGLLTGGDGKPLANYNLIIVATKTSNEILNTADTLIVVGANGAYSFDCKPGEYLVTLSKEGRAATIAGKLTVYADSPDGTLNDYMGAISTELTPEIIRRVREIIAAANLAAEGVIKAVDDAKADLQEIAESSQQEFTELQADIEQFKQQAKTDFDTVVKESVDEVSLIREDAERINAEIKNSVSINSNYDLAIQSAVNVINGIGDSQLRTYENLESAFSDSNIAAREVFRVLDPDPEVGGFMIYRMVNRTQKTATLLTTAIGGQGYYNLNKRFDNAFKETEKVPTDGEPILYAIRDISDNITWLAVSDVDGGPTKHSAKLIAKALGQETTPGVYADQEELFYSVTDNNGNVTDLSIRALDGQFCEFVVKRLAERIKPLIGGGGGGDGTANLKQELPDYQAPYMISCFRGINNKIDNVPPQANPFDMDYGTGRKFRITAGDSYRVGVPSIAILYCGGLNGTNIDWRTEFSGLKPVNMIWAAANFGLNQYGSPTAMQDYDLLVETLLANFNVCQIILFGNSMGAMTALNGLLTSKRARPSGVYLTDPMCNLADRWNSERKEIIRSAYGINSSGSDYAQKTSGYDPMLHRWEDYKGVPFRIIASTNDTTVPYSNNAKMLYDKLSPHVDCTMLTLSSTGHNTADRYDQNDFITWAINSVIKTQNFI